MYRYKILFVSLRHFDQPNNTLYCEVKLRRCHGEQHSDDRRARTSDRRMSPLIEFGDRISCHYLDVLALDPLFVPPHAANV